MGRPAARSQSERPWHALVAEDNLVSQRVVAGHLRRLGAEVDVASTGEEAIAAASARHYDIIFMDRRMPGLDGADATREIRRREGEGPRTPVVAVTADTLPTDRDECLAAGMDDYLTKPVRSADLRRAVERHVFETGHATGEVPELAPLERLPAVDGQVLDRLVALDPDGAGAFLADLARDFDQGFADCLGEMWTAVRTGDAPRLESAAHTLKGSAGLLGARAMAETCRRLENIARRDAVAEAGKLVAGLTQEHGVIMTAIRTAATASLVPAQRQAQPEGRRATV